MPQHTPTKHNNKITFFLKLLACRPSSKHILFYAILLKKNSAYSETLKVRILFYMTKHLWDSPASSHEEFLRTHEGEFKALLRKANPSPLMNPLVTSGKCVHLPAATARPGTKSWISFFFFTFKIQIFILYVDASLFNFLL
jgi:hypothetical protein